MASRTLGPARAGHTRERSFPLGALALAAVVVLIALAVVLALVLGRVGTPPAAVPAPTVTATVAAGQPGAASYLDTAIHERDYCQCQK